jgi:hypothetical protein
LDGELHLLRHRLQGADDDAMRCFSRRAALAAFLVLLPAAAGAVPVVVHLESTAAKSPVRLVFTPIGPSPNGSSNGARSLEAPAPGETTIDLPAGSRWSVVATARGQWARTELFDATAGNEVTVRLMPAGVVRAEIEVAPGELLPPELALRIVSSPARSGAAPALRASEVCPVENRRLACPSPAGTFDLRLRAKGFVSQYRWDRRVPAGGELDLGKLALRRGASVVGTVAAPARDFRFQDCRVELRPRLTAPAAERDEVRSGEKTEVATVNPRGFFELAGVAPGSYRLTVRHPRYAPAIVAPVEVAAGAETEIQRIDLHPPVALAIRLDPASDAYGRRWSIRLSREGEILGVSTLVAEGFVDGQGQWRRAGLAPGEYFVEAIDGRGARWASRRLTLGPEGAAIDLDVPFQRVRGTVTLGDEPLAATLIFGGAHGELEIRAHADEKGSYRVFLPWKSRWDVDVTSQEPRVSSHLQGLEIARRDHAPGELDIALPDTRLPVEVVDEEGRPASRASVRAVREGDRKAVAERVASPEGKVELRGLAPGNWHLEADGTDDAGNRESAAAVRVELREKEPRDAVRLVLKRGWKLSGQVVSPEGGGIFGAEVVATLESSAPLAHLEIPTAHTDIDGVFLLDIPAGVTSVRLTVLAAGFALRQLPPQAPNDGPLIVPVDQEGGTLIVEGVGHLGDYPQQRPAPQLLGRYPLPLGLAYSWAYLNGNSWPAGQMIVPMLEAGTYTVCQDVQEPTAPVRCDSGVLTPGGTLRLRVPRG